jgi:Cu2+-containing amine oxidase
VGIRQLNAEILAELRSVTGDRKIRQKDIMVWMTTPITNTHPDDTYVYLPVLKIHVGYVKRKETR